MKVALYGNICNIFFTLAKCLRQDNLADAHLYLHPGVDFQNRPESDEPDLKNNYPDWIHEDSRWDTLPFLKRRDKSFIKELNQYDIVFLSEFGPFLAPYLKGKTIFFPTGSDLTVTPFPRNHVVGYKSIKDRLVWEYIAFLQKRGIRSVSKIFTQPFFPLTNALEKLKISKTRISPSYYPVLIDTSVIRKIENPLAGMAENNLVLLEPFKFVIFHPSRLVIKKTKKLIDTGHWKGNDNLLKGFALFLKKYQVSDACIALPDRIYSGDRSLAKEIITELGIRSNIVWLQPPSPDGFPRQQLLNFYSHADMVADEFGTGWFGSVVLEGMACEKPTLCFVDEDAMKKMYPWHPILSSNDPAIIADLIARIYFNKEEAYSLGKKSREWIETYHSMHQGQKIYTDNLRKDLFTD